MRWFLWFDWFLVAMTHEIRKINHLWIVYLPNFIFNLHLFQTAVLKQVRDSKKKTQSHWYLIATKRFCFTTFRRDQKERKHAEETVWLRGLSRYTFCTHASIKLQKSLLWRQQSQSHPQSHRLRCRNENIPSSSGSTAFGAAIYGNRLAPRLAPGWTSGWTSGWTFRSSHSRLFFKRWASLSSPVNFWARLVSCGWNRQWSKNIKSCCRQLLQTSN